HSRGPCHDPVLRRLASTVSHARRVSLSLGRNPIAASVRGYRAPGSGVYTQSYLFLLAANFASLECAEISLRSGDAAGLENAPPAGFIERYRHRDCDHLVTINLSHLMEASAILFYVISVFLVLSSLMVVFLRNVVHCALALVMALFLIAVLFVMLHAPMVGVLQVLVYAGAIMVLFLFVIMFLNPTASEPRRRLWWIFGSVAALLLVGGLAALLSDGEAPANPVAAT